MQNISWELVDFQSGKIVKMLQFILITATNYVTLILAIFDTPPPMHTVILEEAPGDPPPL